MSSALESEIQGVLKQLGSKDWGVRSRALERIQIVVEEYANEPSVWTKDILVSLHNPFILQLKDLRSSIVREVSECARLAEYGANES